MEFFAKDVTVTRIKYANLKELEALFEKEFGAEVNMDIVRTRIRRLRQFYGVLLPLRSISPWIRALWNIFIFQVQGVFAGFIQLSYMGNGKLHLDFIAISKTYRGKGLGGYILRGLLKDFADTRSYGVILEVRLDNPAYTLYQGLGFSAKSQILHYERKFSKGEYAEVFARPFLRMEIMKASDRQQVYELYRLNIPETLQGVVGKEQCDFWPSMFNRQMTVIKNKILKNKERIYVLKNKCQIVAAVHMKSYEKASYHILTLHVHPMYELLRRRILEQVLASLSNRYQSGVVGMTIYDDLVTKQHDMETVGFEKKEAYFMMYRKPRQAAQPIYTRQEGGESAGKRLYLNKEGEKVKKR